MDGHASTAVVERIARRTGHDLVHVEHILTQLVRRDVLPHGLICSSSTLELEDLTERQQQVVPLLVEGKSNKEIARELCLAHGTVRVHVALILKQMGVQNRSQAAVAGYRMIEADRERRA